jgi:hypothetical protein
MELRTWSTSGGTEEICEKSICENHKVMSRDPRKKINSYAPIGVWRSNLGILDLVAGRCKLGDSG